MVGSAKSYRRGWGGVFELARSQATAGQSRNAEGGIRRKSSVGAAATFTVNSTADDADASIGDGVCATAASLCTLRAAIAEANATTDADVINITATGTIDLLSSLPDITESLTIDGPGANQLVVSRSTSRQALR